MIEWISSWAETIIIAVIIGTIIEMILPTSSSKKYIKVVIGVYILFTIISPVLSKFTGESIAVSNLLDIGQYMNEIEEKDFTETKVQKSNQDTIREIYIANLKSDMKIKLEGKGYEVCSIDLVIGQDENYTIQKVTLLLEMQKDTEENEMAEDIVDSTIERINEVKIEIGDGNANTNTTIQENVNQEKSALTATEKAKVKEYVSEIYEIDTKNIIIP